MDSEMTAYDLGYQAYGNERQSEQALLHQYLPLVKRTVCSLKSHCGPLIGQEDMEQIALMALLEAARRYPGEYDAGFISFAGQRIRGAILDELRRLDWRPRSVRQQAHSFNDVVRQLTRELGRYPKDTSPAWTRLSVPSASRRHNAPSGARSLKVPDRPATVTG